MTPVLEDLSARHQIVVRSLGAHQITVSCTCLRVKQPGRPCYPPIEMRSKFPASELIAVWQAWHGPAEAIS